MEQKQDNLRMRDRQRAGAGLVRSVASTLLVFVVISFAEPVLRAGEMTEKFKAFIENPPEGMEFYFTKDWPDPVNPAAYPGPSHYYCFWQKSGEITSTSTNLNVLLDTRYDPINTLVSIRYGDRYWNMHHGTPIYRYDDGGPEFERYKSLYDRGLYDLESILNLGITRIKTGRLRWDGNNFSYTNVTTGVTRILNGELIESLEGYPEKVVYNITTHSQESAKPRRFIRQVTFTYGQPFEDFRFVPRKLTYHSIKEGGILKPLHELTIRKVSKIGLKGAEFFEASTFFKPGFKMSPLAKMKPLERIYFVTNGNQVVYYDDNGLLRESTESTPAMERIERQEVSKKWFPYVTVGVALILIILLRGTGWMKPDKTE